MDTYKKKYEEALERAKMEMSKDGMKNDVIAMHLAETIFPELKESEDEKVRKEIVRFIQMEVEDEIIGNKWLDWLGKQCEQKPESNDVVKCLINGMKFYYEDNEEATWGTEKFSMKVKDILTWLENQGEYKVEPKFKVGNWCIDNEDGVIFQIVKILDNTYTYKTNEGKEYSCSHYSLENDAHLWTIQDAKDGDVLAFKNNICGIIICKSPTDYDTRSYCRFVSDNFINKEESGWDSTLLIPATKEQHDLLFQKMNEDGYEWDAEKKELKKIGQKPLKVYRVENEAEEKGLWRKFDGTWQPLFDMLTDGKCKDMPMEDNPIYRDGGKRWFASAPSKEALREWFSKRDLEELVSKGFTITEFEVTEYKKVSDFEYIFTRDNIINKCYLEVSDIYPEQNSTNKDEPKFHEGDWVVYKCDICQIVKREEGCNKLVTNFGIEKELVNERNLSTARLWTIQDAKDGDVLSYVTDEEDLWIMIYWSLYEPYEGHVHYHALLVNDNFSDKGTCCICINDLKPATKEQRDLLFQKMHETGYDWNANKKELVTIKDDINKPKFNIGDWVVDKNGTVHQILSYKDGIYKHTNGYSSKMFEDEWRLWDITKDAKGGDVLATDDGNIFVFDDTVKDGKYPFAYCGLTRHRFEIYDKRLPFTHNNIYPATKEQRDILFEEMQKKGYEWDTEKKALKKIIAPIFHIGDRVRYKGHSCDGVITEITNTDYICGDAKLPISTQDKLELVKQDSALNEEDDDDAWMNDIISKVENNLQLNKAEIDWLNSLKERIN